MLKLYGIPNCDQVKRARNWLEKNNLAYEFFDFKKNRLSEKQLSHWLAVLGADKLINRRSTTWRQLTEQQKTDLNALQAQADNLADNCGLQLLIDNPTLLKRPVLISQKQVQAGFDQTFYQSLRQ